MAPSRTRWTTWRRFTHQRSAVRYRPRPPVFLQVSIIWRSASRVRTLGRFSRAAAVARSPHEDPRPFTSWPTCRTDLDHVHVAPARRFRTTARVADAPASIFDEVVHPVRKLSTLQLAVHHRAGQTGEQAAEGPHEPGHMFNDQVLVPRRVLVQPAQHLRVDLALRHHPHWHVRSEEHT